MRTTRVGALVAGSALTLGLLSATPAVTAADPEPKALADSISWVQSQLGANGMVPGFSGAGDYSLTADYALGLEEVGRSSELQSVASSLVDEAAQAGDGATSFKTARAAAAIWASDVVGEDASDLIALLEGSIADGDEVVMDDGEAKTVSPNAVGRAIDKPFDDWTGTIGQAWAYTVLSDAGSEEADDALAFLLAQQCPAGWFRYSWSAIDATDQSCDDRDDGSYADPDTTAYVAILLADVEDPDARAAVAKAVDWLLAQQSTAHGGLAAGYDPGAFNANTTGLAARAFRLNGEKSAAVRAATWLRRHQLVALPGCARATDAEKGAIAPNDSDLDGLDNGIPTTTRGSWQFSTAQAFAGLVALPAANPAPTVVVPRGFQQGGTTVSVALSGALAYDEICLAVGASRTVLPAGARTRTIALPNSTGNLSVTGTTASGAVGSAMVSVLGAKKVPFRMAKKVKRKRRLNVLVSGLAPAEKVTVRFRKRVFRRTASPAGTAIFRIKVGKKVGKVKVRVMGQFPAIRHNTKTVRVRR